MSAKVLSLVEARRHQPSPAEAARIHAREHAESVVSMIERWESLTDIKFEISRMVSALRGSEELE